MKVRRSSRSVDLKNLPLDGLDMFLLVQLEGTLTTAELCDIAPCEKEETMRRLEQLEGFGIVEFTGETAAEIAELEATRARRMRKERPAARSAEPPKAEAFARRTAFDDESTKPVPHAALVDEDSTTLRPPPDKRTRKMPPVMVQREDEAVTLRPPKPVSVEELMSAAEELTSKIKVQRSSGVVEKPLRGEAQERSKVASRAVSGSVYSRQTLVDAEVNDRARAFEERVPVRRR